jgi:hypothetical protein
MSPSPGTNEKFEGSAQPVTPAEMMAELNLLGHGEIGGDPESKQFFDDVDRLNPGWRSGDVPRVPGRYRNGAAHRAVLSCVSTPTAESARPRERRHSRPREQRTGRGRSRRGPPSSDDDPDPPASPFQATWRNALYLTAGELDALVSHARIRIKTLRRRAA